MKDFVLRYPGWTTLIVIVVMGSLVEIVQAIAAH